MICDISPSPSQEHISILSTTQHIPCSELFCKIFWWIDRFKNTSIQHESRHTQIVFIGELHKSKLKLSLIKTSINIPKPLLVHFSIFRAETFVILALATTVSSVGAKKFAIPSLNAPDYANTTGSCKKILNH